jgi:hypothetical protein
MIIVEDYEAIRRAYYLEKKSIRQIAREQHHSRRTIRKALQQVHPHPYYWSIPQPSPIFGALPSLAGFGKWCKSSYYGCVIPVERL